MSFSTAEVRSKQEQDAVLTWCKRIIHEPNEIIAFATTKTYFNAVILFTSAECSPTEMQVASFTMHTLHTDNSVIGVVCHIVKLGVVSLDKWTFMIPIKCPFTTKAKSYRTKVHFNDSMQLVLSSHAWKYTKRYCDTVASWNENDTIKWQQNQIFLLDFILFTTTQNYLKHRTSTVMTKIEQVF